MENYINLYPTPKTLLDKILSGVDFYKVKTVLEPSAAKGDIVDYIKERCRYNHEIDIDCIEINEELQSILKGKGYRVVFNDFLSFNTFKKYDLIVMNPPFDKGCDHLLKALKLQERGGRIICILNAETIRNPYSLNRKKLRDILSENDASITYMQDEFVSAERRTTVEIAVVDVTIPEEEKSSFILENLKRASMIKEAEERENTDVAENDYIRSVVKCFEIEVQAGLKLIREYKAMLPHIMNEIAKDEMAQKYNVPIISLKVGKYDDNLENRYLTMVRAKYWRCLFKDERFTKGMTSELYRDYMEKVDELKNYDFNIYNIKEIQLQICNSLKTGIEDTIMKLFDDLSYVHAWNSEFGNNVHYYNGWATNKAWYVNKKVVLPVYNVFSNIWKKFQYRYDLCEKLRDIEKAFDYLAGTPGRDSFLGPVLEKCEKEQITKNIECRYFTFSVYKKGTIHITFKDDELLKRFNIFAGKNKNMLPPSYGKKKYEDMSDAEKSVINGFDGGKDEYDKIIADPDKYLLEIATTKLQLCG